MAPAGESFEILQSRSHGAVLAARVAFRRLGVAELLGSRKSPERDTACAMIAARIIRPHQKLGTVRWWAGTTLPDEFGVGGADENDLYAAMDWLLARQSRIEGKLAGRHLAEGGLVLFDLSSSRFEGTACPLRAQPRRQERKAAGQLRPDVRRRRAAGGGFGPAGRRPRPRDPAAGGGAPAPTLRDPAHCRRRRPRHDRAGGHRPAAAERSSRSTRPGCSSCPTPTSPASA